MVMGDTSFTTVAGEEISRAIIVQNMIDFYNEKYPDVQITDFNDGSVIRNIIESLAVELFHKMQVDNDVDKRAFISTCTGNYLDLHGADINAPRSKGNEAWGVVTFTIPTTEAFEIVIPMDTILVSSETGLQFRTVNDTYIKVGETSADTAVRSVVVGDNCNAAAGTVNTFYDVKPYSTLTVSNSEAFTGGKDSETDDEYRARLLKLKQQDNFGSIDYYTGLGMEIEGVHDVLIIDSASYTGTVLVNGDSKPVSNDVLSLVTAAYSDEDNLVYRHSFEVAATEYTTVNLAIECDVSQEMATTEFTNVLTQLFDGSDGKYNGLSINEPLSRYMIMSALELDLPFVYQITDLTSGGSTFSKLTPATNKVLKLGTVSVTQNVVE